MTTLTLDELGVAPPPRSRADWNDDGVVVLPNLIDNRRIAAYQAAWAKANDYRLPYGIPPIEAHRTCFADRPGGWPDCTPYMRHPEILDLLAPVAPIVEALLGEPAGVHLNLTGWVTTTRDWHQDSYLNPPEVGDFYAAVWIALGDVHPDSGPFQYVPGSHRWPQVTRQAIWQAMDGYDAPDWPRRSEEILSPMFAAEIEARGAEVVTHLPHRGDVLIWHGRLLHRGSVAKVPGAYRPAFIAHLSGIGHRSDMPPAVQRDDLSWFFPIEGGQV